MVAPGSFDKVGLAFRHQKFVPGAPGGLVLRQPFRQLSPSIRDQPGSGISAAQCHARPLGSPLEPFLATPEQVCGVEVERSGFFAHAGN
jgi:hypothetical protein